VVGTTQLTAIPDPMLFTRMNEMIDEWNGWFYTAREQDVTLMQCQLTECSNSDLEWTKTSSGPLIIQTQRATCTAVGNDESDLYFTSNTPPPHELKWWEGKVQQVDLLLENLSPVTGNKSARCCPGSELCVEIGWDGCFVQFEQHKSHHNLPKLFTNVQIMSGFCLRDGFTLRSFSQLLLLRFEFRKVRRNRESVLFPMKSLKCWFCH
jgi:hypothetical protein